MITSLLNLGELFPGAQQLRHKIDVVNLKQSLTGFPVTRLRAKNRILCQIDHRWLPIARKAEAHRRQIANGRSVPAGQHLGHGRRVIPLTLITHSASVAPAQRRGLFLLVAACAVPLLMAAAYDLGYGPNTVSFVPFAFVAMLPVYAWLNHTAESMLVISEAKALRAPLENLFGDDSPEVFEALNTGKPQKNADGQRSLPACAGVEDQVRTLAQAR